MQTPEKSSLTPASSVLSNPTLDDYARQFLVEWSILLSFEVKPSTRTSRDVLVLPGVLCGSYKNSKPPSADRLMLVMWGRGSYALNREFGSGALFKALSSDMQGFDSIEIGYDSENSTSKPSRLHCQIGLGFDSSPSTVSTALSSSPASSSLATAFSSLHLLPQSYFPHLRLHCHLQVRVPKLKLNALIKCRARVSRLGLCLSHDRPVNPLHDCVIGLSVSTSIPVFAAMVVKDGPNPSALANSMYNSITIFSLEQSDDMTVSR
ncbi:hypothetical protein PVK06_005041 [Gossypium arboreum]|uniref:Uncharacterized protein n=1 Tax=Gossypium arboreum TaxID=29729 RepID=A0ABR0QTS8_GOSAR|nr:hypothetical protein PVK06_005041 [Gossypium arboreum]